MDKILPMRVDGEIVSPGEISGYMVIHSSVIIFFFYSGMQIDNSMYILT